MLQADIKASAFYKHHSNTLKLLRLNHRYVFLVEFFFFFFISSPTLSSTQHILPKDLTHYEQCQESDSPTGVYSLVNTALSKTY